MGSLPTLLTQLRLKTLVDCDTLDASVAETLGPFNDCTSNQAIAYFELLHTHHSELIKQSALLAKELSTKYPDVKTTALAVEACVMISCHGSLPVLIINQ